MVNHARGTRSGEAAWCPEPLNRVRRGLGPRGPRCAPSGPGGARRCARAGARGGSAARMGLAERRAARARLEAGGGRTHPPWPSSSSPACRPACRGTIRPSSSCGAAGRASAAARRTWGRAGTPVAGPGAARLGAALVASAAAAAARSPRGVAGRARPRRRPPPPARPWPRRRPAARGLTLGHHVQPARAVGGSHAPRHTHSPSAAVVPLLNAANRTDHGPSAPLLFCSFKPWTLVTLPGRRGGGLGVSEAARATTFAQPCTSDKRTNGSLHLLSFSPQPGQGLGGALVTCARPLEAWHVVGNDYMSTLLHTSPCPRGDSGRGMSPSVESGAGVPEESRVGRAEGTV